MTSTQLGEFVAPVAATPDRSPGDGVAPARRQRDQPQRRRQPRRTPQPDDKEDDRNVGKLLDVMA